MLPKRLGAWPKRLGAWPSPEPRAALERALSACSWTSGRATTSGSAFAFLAFVMLERLSFHVLEEAASFCLGL